MVMKYQTCRQCLSLRLVLVTIVITIVIVSSLLVTTDNWQLPSYVRDVLEVPYVLPPLPADQSQNGTVYHVSSADQSQNGTVYHVSSADKSKNGKVNHEQQLKQPKPTEAIQVPTNQKPECWESPYVLCEGETNTFILNKTYSKTHGTFMPVKYDLDKISKLPPGLKVRPLSQIPTVVTDKKIFKVALYNKQNYVSPLDFSKCKFRNCEYVGTEITNQTDVVVALGVGLNANNVPQRWPHQLYAMIGWESPVHYRHSAVLTGNNKWSNAFNITITYRRDADVFAPYGKIDFNPAQAKNMNLTDFALKKTKTALWIASNCGSAKRLQYVRELQKYIDVDIYGACSKPCENKPRGLCVPTEPYKFYLSFENSFCEDYTTEKVFKIFIQNYTTVPIVRGGGDYNNILPPKSFIDAGQYKTAKDLAMFMKHLSQKENVHEYVEYLKTRMMYSAEPKSINNYHCGLCEYLNKRDQTKEKVYDMPTWLGSCHGTYMRR